MSLKDLKKAVWEANQGIFKAGLVTMHSGNASGIDRARGLVVIKPSGMDYDKMRPSDMVVTDLNGKPVPDSKWKPSVDLPHHLYLYKNRLDIGGVIHTHSNYATSFALLGRSIPAYLTAIADEFGGEIPCIPYIDNQADNIGQAILEHIGASPAVLLAHHGAFAVGKTPRDALKAAVMLEDVAHTCHLALLKGDPQPLPPHEVKKWFDRYHTSYGQNPTKKKRRTK
jgi:L-ribulose-5-phosphate 4-epimerase